MDNLDRIKFLTHYPLALDTNVGTLHCNKDCSVDNDNFLDSIPSLTFDLELFIDALINHIKIHHPESMVY